MSGVPWSRLDAYASLALESDLVQVRATYIPLACLRRQVRGFGRILRADMREMDTVRPEAASTAQGQDRPGAALHNNKNAAYWRGWE
jgi:hypothetical protein